MMGGKSRIRPRGTREISQIRTQHFVLGYMQPAPAGPGCIVRRRV